MSILRQFNWLSSQRVDLPYLKLLELSACGDFDALCGQMMAGREPLIVRGFTITAAGITGPANALQLNTSDSALLSYGASESGTMFYSPVGAGPEVLGSTNPNVYGSFTNGTTNYVGIDLIRAQDDTTSDLSAFLVPNLDEEEYQTVDLGITLKYRIVISTQTFSAASNVVPIAKVVVSSTGVATSITDARPMMFRLGTGGDAPNTGNSFTWTGNRIAEPAITSTSAGSDPFQAADKSSIGSFKNWQDAVMSRLWETGGGSNWYAPTSTSDVFMVRTGAPLVGHADQFYFDGTKIYWQNIGFVFANSTATTNTVTDNPSTGVALPLGSCLYADVDRTNDGAIIALSVAAMRAVYVSAPIPGSRIVVAWRTAAGVFARGSPNPIGLAVAPATNTYMGVVQLHTTSGTPTDPIVPTIGTSGNFEIYSASTPVGLQYGSPSSTRAQFKITNTATFGPSHPWAFNIGTSNSVGDGRILFGLSDNSIAALTLSVGVSTLNTALSLAPTAGTGGSQLLLGRDTLSNGLNATATTAGASIDAGGNTGPYNLTLKGGGTGTHSNSIGTVLDTEDAYTTAGALITSFRNNTVEKANIDKDGNLYSAGALVSAGSIAQLYYGDYSTYGSNYSYVIAAGTPTALTSLAVAACTGAGPGFTITASTGKVAMNYAGLICQYTLDGTFSVSANQNYQFYIAKNGTPLNIGITVTCVSSTLYQLSLSGWAEATSPGDYLQVYCVCTAGGTVYSGGLTGASTGSFSLTVNKVQ